MKCYLIQVLNHNNQWEGVEPSFRSSEKQAVKKFSEQAQGSEYRMLNIWNGGQEDVTPENIRDELMAPEHP